MRGRFGSRRLGIAVTAALSVVGLVAGTGWGAPGPVASPGPSGGERPGGVPAVGVPAADRKAGHGDRAVTLVTGDRVVLAGGDARRVSVIPGNGRKQVKFRTRLVGGRLSVVPSDVAGMVAAGRLDERLFEVTGLIRDGYDDRASKSIPLIVSYDGAAGRSAVRGAGAVMTRDLPSVNGAAVRVPKSAAGRFLAGLPTSGRRRFGGGVKKVWLDGKRRITLDQSVKQIGAPTAWQAGFTGKGVTVAVLDTGVDATHPDLASRVVGAKNFTEGPVDDLVGHGTHVASTIAGTAAASGGKFKGVAPEAKILDGKVCEYESCSESAILAGMEWAAAEKKADVINMSLGGPNTPDIDPMEEAVNRLTAQTGSLFVIAAGNEGPDAGSVASPGSADAALTVGAVDREDQLAEFSSRGPRAGDEAIKPDVTAPGVDIVAARAKGTEMGEPVDDHHARSSGTSMATPHTAGAAALLAQQHPDWSAARLKGALMASAKPHPQQGVFEQGAGRIDVGRAVKQTVVSEPGSLSFGLARWPHTDDTPVARQLTYRNLGTTDLTLSLEATLTGPDGKPAPQSALKVSASSVTVPAGDTAAVSVTSDTRHSGPDGLYSGRVTATGPGGVSVVTPLGTDKETERYDVTVTHRDPDGKTTGNGETTLYDIDHMKATTLSEEDGTTTVRLPKGRYLLDGFVRIDRGDGKVDQHEVIQPMLRLDKDTSVTVDARLTKPIKTTVPRPDAKAALVVTGAKLEPADGLVIDLGMHSFTGEGLFTAPLGDPVTAPDKLTAYVASHWAAPGSDGEFGNSPYTYGLVNTQQGRYYHGFNRVVKDSELARVEANHHAQVDKREAEKFVHGVVPGMGLALAPRFRFDLPSKVTHYLEAGPTWTGQFSEFVLDPDEGYPVNQSWLSSPERTYQAGRRYAERWNATVFGPRFLGKEDASRAADSISVHVPMYSDRDGHRGYSETDTASTKLYREGTLIGETDQPSSLTVDDVAPEPAGFKLVSTATRPGVSKFSTRTDAAWTFRSQTAAEDDEPLPLPLWAVRYFPLVDSRNTVRRTKVTVLPVKLETPPGAKAGRLGAVQVQVSGNDGKTWTKASVRRIADNRYVAAFVTPKGAGHVSLRSKAADSAGNTTEQTIIRAYALR